MEQLSFLLYRSETDIRTGSSAARQILAQARDRNAELNLTGFLHHEEGFFFQWLEGPPENIDVVGRRIMDDPRHHSLAVLLHGPLEARQFAQWRMAYSTDHDESILSWLAENPVPQRDQREYAHSVLNFLRERNRSAEAD